MILKNGFIYKTAYIEEVDISSGANFGSVKFFLREHYQMHHNLQQLMIL